MRNRIVKVLQSDSRRPCGYTRSSLDRAVCRARPVEIVKVVQPPGSSFENHLHLPCTCTYLCPYALISLSSYRVTRFPTIELNSFCSLLYPLYLPPSLRFAPFFFLQIIDATDIDLSRKRNLGSLEISSWQVASDSNLELYVSNNGGEGDRFSYSCANLASRI